MQKFDYKNLDMSVKVRAENPVGCSTKKFLANSDTKMNHMRFINQLKPVSPIINSIYCCF